MYAKYRKLDLCLDATINKVEFGDSPLNITPGDRGHKHYTRIYLKIIYLPKSFLPDICINSKK